MAFTTCSSFRKTWTFSPRVKIPYAALNLNNNLVTGVDWENWDYKSDRTNPSSATAQQHNTAVYAQNVTMLTPATTVSIGGRLQRIEFDASDSTVPSGAASGEQNRNLSAYEVGARQQMGESTSVYGKYGYSFRVATLDEVYSPGLGAFLIPPSLSFLEPQTSHDSEIGLQTRSGPGAYRISLHRSDLKNEIHFDSNAGVNVNLPPTKRSSVEVEGKWALTTNASLFANYTYTEAKFRSATLNGIDVSGNRIPLVPRHMANAGIDWTIQERTRVNVTANYVGSQLYDGDEGNTFGQEMPSYWTADLGIFHTVDNWTFGASVHNIFDEKYYTYALAITFPTNTFVAYPAPERNFLVSVQYRFAK